jgi:ribosomal protein S18 acetylase RimI-like enzyme
MLSFQVARPEHAVALARLVNSAYRGESSRQGWTTEAELLDGQRTDPEALIDTISNPDRVILLFGDEVDPAGCVMMERRYGICYIGMVTVKPTQQKQGLGKHVLSQAELWVNNNWNANKVEMTVIHKRHALIEFYKRRGYTLTELRRPFPYGEPRFGIPKTDDLEFVVLQKDISPVK